MHGWLACDLNWTRFVSHVTRCDHHRHAVKARQQPEWLGIHAMILLAIAANLVILFKGSTTD